MKERNKSCVCATHLKFNVVASDDSSERISIGQAQSSRHKNEELTVKVEQLFKWKVSLGYKEHFIRTQNSREIVD